MVVRCDIPFTEAIIRQAWLRSGGRCECTKQTHTHIGRCNRKLLELYRGDDETIYGWEAQSKSGTYKDLDDCEIVCLDCQEQYKYI
jgi:hypothetical protein